MRSRCCVVNCENRRKDVNLFKFPKCEKRLQKWLESIPSGLLRSTSLQNLRKQFLCLKHFEARFLTPSTHLRRRLRECAHPTLFTTEEMRTGIPQTAKNVVESGVSYEHNYAKKRHHEDHTYCKVDEAAEKRFKISGMDATPSTSSSKDRVLNWANNAVISEERCKISGMDATPSPSSSKDRVLNSANNTVISEEQCKISGMDATPSPSSSKDKVLNSENNTVISENETCVPQNEVTMHSIGTEGNISLTPRLSTKRRHVILKRKDLTPKCARLYNEYCKSKRQLSFSKRVRRAMKFSKEASFEKLTQNMHPLRKKLLWMQIRHDMKKSKGRRYTMEEKLIALSIMKHGAKSYRHLRLLFILPSKSTLNKIISKINIGVGVKTQIFGALKQEVTTWDENKKYCSILFDEIALEAGLTYDKHRDIIDGFVELNSKTKDFADHALVFMLRGAVINWQQPVAYYFCKGATSTFHLKLILKDVVMAVGDTGLIPIALVCDQGTSFQSALKSLKEDTRRQQLVSGDNTDDTIIINEHVLSVIYDPPHLIKGLRNNFLSKDIKCNGKISKWSDIVEVYKADCSHAQMRLLYKLNDEHVIPEKIKKMKVKNCVRVFSKTMAATLSFTAQFSNYGDGKEVSTTMKNTAETVSFFDDLFDSVNGSTLHAKKNKGKRLRQAVTNSSEHHQFWNAAIKKLKNLKFIDGSGKETSVPSIKNWISTLESYQRLWKFFKLKNLKVMRPRNFNSDPIENFFGQVRAYNFRNNDPNCRTFKSTFKSLLITRFLKYHSEGFNCEEDSGDTQYLKLKYFFDAENTNERSPESSNFDDFPQEIQVSAREERVQIQARAYTTGWVLKKIMPKIHNCQACSNNLLSNDDHNINNFIKFKEYTKNKNKLNYPSEYAVRVFGEIIKESNKYLESQPERTGILKEIAQYIKSKHLFDFLTCNEHKDLVIKNFVEITVRLLLFNWCNVINKILKGTDVARLEKKDLPPMQQKALLKYKTKLKNKRINK